MNSQSNRKTALLVAAMALGFGAAPVLDSIGNVRFSTGELFNSAQAAEGHDSGGHTSGGHTGGKGGSKGGHDSGGHDSGGGSEEKGHGTRLQHKGHSSGQHGSGSSHSGSERFGGGSGLRGNAQVPEGIGRYGEGAAGNEQGRTRYWGGWTLPEGPTEPPQDPVITTTSTDLVPGSGGGQSVSARSVLDGATRCEGVTPGMAPAQQFSGSNLLRLNTARGVVDPELAASGKIASPFLMGNLQEELIKAAPNAELAGTYLGLIAKAPVTADAVKKISFQLCARINDAQAKEIADIAETQRKTLAAAAKTNQ